MRFAYRLYDRAEEDAIDLLSETLCKAIEDYGLYDTERPLYPYVSTIMKNKFLVEYNRRALWFGIRDRIRDESLSIEKPDEGVGVDFEILERYRRRETRLFCEGYSYKEISEIVGVCTGTIKSRIWANRKQLIELLETY